MEMIPDCVELPDGTSSGWEWLADSVGADELAERLSADPTNTMLLAALISAVSEEAWCATWHLGVELWAWDGFASWVNAGSDIVRVVVVPSVLEALARAKEALGGAWVAWHRDHGVVALTADEWSPRAGGECSFDMQEHGGSFGRWICSAGDDDALSRSGQAVLTFPFAIRCCDVVGVEDAVERLAIWRPGPFGVSFGWLEYGCTPSADDPGGRCA